MSRQTLYPKKQHTGVGTGASSILAVFVILALVTFAVLSLVSARADARLTEKALQHSRQYYTAENRATEKLDYLDAVMQYNYIEKSSEKYFAMLKSAAGTVADISYENGEIFLTYEEKINDAQKIYVKLKANYPVAKGKGFYTIKSWQAVNTQSWQPQDKLPLLGS